jgi:hypothetical protein
MFMMKSGTTAPFDGSEQAIEFGDDLLVLGLILLR